MKRIFLSIPWLLLFFSITALGKPAKPIALNEVLYLAEKNSYLLSASRFKELAANKSIDIARANYFPTLNVEGIDSKGFPGSSGQLNVGGLMGSPYRSGYGVGLVAQQTIWDFGRTSSGVAIAKSATSLSQEDTQVSAYKVKLLALKTFYACSMYRTQRDLWSNLAQGSSVISNEVKHFVNTGQRSIVDKYLSEAQTQEAYTGVAFFGERLKDATRELAVIMGVRDNSFSCPPLPSRGVESISSDADIENSPLLKYAIADSQVAAAQLKYARANYFPKIVALASVGDLQDERLVPRQTYAIGVGVIFPLFDLHTISKVHQAEATVDAKNESVAAEKQNLEEANGKYDETIDSAKVQLKHLNYELQLANKAFAVAKERYFSLSGDLVDLREAFRNLTRAQTQLIATRAELLQARGEKLLMNGDNV